MCTSEKSIHFTVTDPTALHDTPSIKSSFIISSWKISSLSRQIVLTTLLLGPLMSFSFLLFYEQNIVSILAHFSTISIISHCLFFEFLVDGSDISWLQFQFRRGLSSTRFCMISTYVSVFKNCKVFNPRKGCRSSHVKNDWISTSNDDVSMIKDSSLTLVRNSSRVETIK